MCRRRVSETSRARACIWSEAAAHVVATLGEDVAHLAHLGGGFVRGGAQRLGVAGQHFFHLAEAVHGLVRRRGHFTRLHRKRFLDDTDARQHPVGDLVQAGGLLLQGLADAAGLFGQTHRRLIQVGILTVEQGFQRLDPLRQGGGDIFRALAGIGRGRRQQIGLVGEDLPHLLGAGHRVLRHLVQGIGMKRHLSRQALGPLRGPRRALVDGFHLLMHGFAEFPHLGGGGVGDLIEFLGLQAQQMLHLARPGGSVVGGTAEAVHFVLQGIDGGTGVTADPAQHAGQGFDLPGQLRAHLVRFHGGAFGRLGQRLGLGHQRIRHRFHAVFRFVGRISQTTQMVVQFPGHHPHDATAIQPGQDHPQQRHRNEGGADDAPQFLGLQGHHVVPADIGVHVLAAKAQPDEGRQAGADIDGTHHARSRIGLFHAGFLGRRRHQRFDRQNRRRVGNGFHRHGVVAAFRHILLLRRLTHPERSLSCLRLRPF
ncbi:MAG: hypothetical protein HYU59_09615 [Magnetospirillum gryphiswaldense]|nr:hypothetical protein [Magnetospirillum gryphiswaldense]